MTAQNCTATARTVSVQWYARFAGPGGGIPADCIAMDPLVLPLALRPAANEHLRHDLPHVRLVLRHRAGGERAAEGRFRECRRHPHGDRADQGDDHNAGLQGRLHAGV